MNKQELIEKINEIATETPFPDSKIVDLSEAIELIEQLDEPIKLKDVIKRIKDLDIDARKVWIDAILNELGSDYGSLKYRTGYEQGKFDCAMEYEKVTVPKFVADWINKCKVFEHLVNLSFALNPISWEENRLSDECIDWLKSTSNQEVFARAWLDGYTVEEEKRYYVRLKGVDENYNYFNCIKHLNEWALTEIKTDKKFRTTHTRKQLEEAGFGWVFDCPGIEIEEVEE